MYDHSKQAPQSTPREYGRALKPPQLPEAIARFFPLSLSENGPTGEGLPGRLLAPILQGIMAELEKVKLALKPLDYTMIGASVLIVYEADWDRAAEGLEHLSQHPVGGGEEE